MAVKAPKVQTLAQAMADLNPAYAASKNVINQEISGLGAKYDAQRAAINAERGQGFNAINNQATGRGGSFSGIPIDEQATYLSTKYLPGMQQANYQQNQEGLTYKGQLADLGKEQRTTALGTIQQQKSDLNSWNSARAAEAAQAKQAALDRANAVKLKQMEINASAARAAASRAASAPAKLTPYQAAMALISPAAAKGGVSANVFQLARDAYRAAGGNTGKFASDFWKYVPKNSNWKDYYYG